MRNKYNENYERSPLPDELKDGPEFLVGGYGRDDDFPSLYRIQVKENKVEQELIDGNTGIAWNDQSDAVERFIRGYDSILRWEVEDIIRKSLAEYENLTVGEVAKIANSIVAAIGTQMPAGIDTKLPTPSDVKIGWKNFRVNVDYANFPIQEADEID